MAVENPANARTELTVATRRQHGRNAQRNTSNIHPERQVVHTWERHVRSADLQRHQVVTETTEQSRNNHEEHHQNTVIGDHNVPEVTVRSTGRRSVRDETRTFKAHVLNARMHQLETHVDGKSDRDETYNTRYEQVHDPDVFVVGGHEPTGKEAPFVVMFMAMDGCICHVALPFWSNHERTESQTPPELWGGSSASTRFRQYSKGLIR